MNRPLALALVTAHALSACTPPDEGPAVRPDTSTAGDTAGADTATAPACDSTAPASDTADSGTSADTATLDCTLPPVPFPFVALPGFGYAEDFDFSGDGLHVSNQNTHLVAEDQAGTHTILSPNLGFGTSGTRVLPSGEWVVNSVDEGSLWRIDPVTGARTTVASNLAYPNGLEVASDGFVYVAENYADRVLRIDPYTGDQLEVAQGLRFANGVILSPDEQILYVGSFGAGKVYAVDRLGPDDWDAPRVLYDAGPDASGFDGINVDACGNVYVTQPAGGRVTRITPDGANVELAAELPSGWIPNMRWGVGTGGWDPDLLYVSDRHGGNLFALDPGLPGKKHLLAP